MFVHRSQSTCSSSTVQTDLLKNRKYLKNLYYLYCHKKADCLSKEIFHDILIATGDVLSEAKPKFKVYKQINN